MKYSFPKARYANENNTMAQAMRIQSECNAFISEAVFGRPQLADREAADMYHSLETYFRMREKAGADIDAVFKAVEQKNRDRGYYLDGNKAD